MILPFDRKRLRERNKSDALEQQADAARQSPSERVERALELSDFVRELAQAALPEGLGGERSDLEEKAHLYAAPLRLLAERG